MRKFFARLKSMFGGPVPYETLAEFSTTAVSGLLEELDEQGKCNFEIVLQQKYPEIIVEWKNYPKLLSQWENRYLASLRDATSVTTSQQQKINLRKLVLDINETRIMNRIWRDNYNENDRKILFEEIFARDTTLEDWQGTTLITVMETEMSLILLRQIQRWYYDDFHKDDYFSMHTHMFELLTTNMYETVLAEHKGKDHVPSTLLPVIRQAVEKIKNDALDGKDKIYPERAEDDLSIEREPESSENKNRNRDAT